MSDDNSNAGKLVSGKEAERAPQELKQHARKMNFEIASDVESSATTGSVAIEKSLATKCDDSEIQDEFVSDVLARFGIQI